MFVGFTLELIVELGVGTWVWKGWRCSERIVIKTDEPHQPSVRKS